MSGGGYSGINTSYNQMQQRIKGYEAIININFSKTMQETQDEVTTAIAATYENDDECKKAVEGFGNAMRCELAKKTFPQEDQYMGMIELYGKAVEDVGLSKPMSEFVGGLVQQYIPNN